MNRRNAITAVIAILTGIAGALGYRALGSEPQQKLGQRQATTETPRVIVAARGPDRVDTPLTQLPKLPSRDPNASDYDPVALAQVLELPLSDLMAAEPRDHSWAERLEQLYRHRMMSDLADDFPELTLERIVCHASSCELELAGPDAVADDAYDYVQRFIPLGNLFEPNLLGKGADGRRILQFKFLVSPEIRPADQYEDWYQRVRDTRADRLAAYREERSGR